MSAGKFEDDYAIGSRFWLGPIKAKHEIGEYQFIEYEEIVPGSNPKIKTGNRCFSIYHNKVSMGRIANSLDEALLTAVALKIEGPNTQAPTFFLRMLGMVSAHNLTKEFT